jgi:hypothetical protein
MENNTPVQKAFFMLTEKLARQIAVINANI